VVADRFYPSSKTCSACGWVKPSSPWPSAPSPARSAGCGSTGISTPPTTSPSSHSTSPRVAGDAKGPWSQP
jgi:hypothetical protein